MKHLSLIISLLALIVASTTGGYAAWTEFSQVRITPNYGEWALQVGRSDVPCIMLGVIGGTHQLGTGYDRDANGNCDTRMGIGFVEGSHDRQFVITPNMAFQRPAAITIEDPTGTHSNMSIGNWDGDIVIYEDIVTAQVRGRINKDGSYEFPNGCRIYPDGAALRSSCKIRMPLW